MAEAFKPSWFNQETSVEITTSSMSSDKVDLEKLDISKKRRSDSPIEEMSPTKKQKTKDSDF